MKLCLDHVEEEDAIIAIVLSFILGFVEVVLLIEVVLWWVGVVLSSDPRLICLIASFNVVASVDIGINVCRIGIGVGVPLVVICIEAALGVGAIAVVGRAWYCSTTPHVGLSYQSRQQRR